jgi:succinate dehydrogenase / fumarate reductase flavoprotein subunit
MATGARPPAPERPPQAAGAVETERSPARPALDARAPSGPLASAWGARKREFQLSTRARRRDSHVVVVGSGLAGASLAASLSELGHRVTCLCFQDSPRRAHSVAAQGGINACKNYQNDGDSAERLFVDTLKGGDYRSREANVYRLAQLSVDIIDQCVAQGVPFAREYAGYLANRSFGGALVSRTFYARGVTGQQLLLGAYQALSKEVGQGGVTLLPRREMLELIVEGDRVRGVVARQLATGEVEAHVADAVVLATGGYANVFQLSTNAQGSNATAVVRAYQRGAAFANPCFVQFHPTCLPPSGEYQSKLLLMSEALRNDGRIWVPARAGDTRCAADIPDAERDYYLERLYPRYGNLAPRDIASRAAKARCDEGLGVGPGGRGVYLDLRDAARREGQAKLEERYGNLFEMYRRAAGTDPLEQPMIIFPAAHYSMGGLWVDYDLMSTLPGLFVIGEANFSDHGANRLGASALLQGLADGYFIAPLSVSSYLASHALPAVPLSASGVREALGRVSQRTERLLGVRGGRSALDFHVELGQLLWHGCGLSRDAADLERTGAAIRQLRHEFWQDVRVPGQGSELNQELERAGRVADFLLLGELMCRDALARDESAGCHHRVEHQSADGEGRRDDAGYAHVAAWFYTGDDAAPRPERERLVFSHSQPSQRSYR